MITHTAALLPLLPAVLLGASGTGKLARRSLLVPAERSALAGLLGTPRRAALLLRGLGAVEVLLAAALLAAAPLAGAATALLGAGFLAYLGYARAVAPGSSCGCSAREDTPVTWRTFARAGAVVLGGAAAATAAGPWWETVAQRPLTAALLLTAGTAASAWLFSPTTARRAELWLRRARLRITGHPLPAGDGRVPVQASVELLERSLAWEAASPVVRSGLLEHWDEDGWRILRYSGAYRGRPVAVLFALDAAAHLDRPRGSAVRVSVVDPDTEEVMAAALHDAGPDGRRLPVAG